MTLHYTNSRGSQTSFGRTLCGQKDDSNNFSSVFVFSARDAENGHDLCPKCAALDALKLDTPLDWNVIDEEV